MDANLSPSGIERLGGMPWGTHFCVFYETKEDLLDTLVPYFKAGLENDEFCVWVVADPLTEEDASRALSQAVPDFERHRSNQSIELLPARDWYLNNGRFELDRVTTAWNRKLNQALARGYAGMRVSGDTLWLEKKTWQSFYEYERHLDESITERRMTVLCTYPLPSSGAAEILDVARNHQFALARRGGVWDVIETPELKLAKAEIKSLNEQLEQRVAERTAELAATNEQLQREAGERKQAEEALRRSEINYRALAENSVQGIAIFQDQKMVYANPATARIMGYTVEELTSMSAEQIVALTHPIDRPLAVERVRKRTEGESLTPSIELRILRKDGSTGWVQAFNNLIEYNGRPAILSTTLDITERKRAEQALRKSEGLLREAESLGHTGSWEQDLVTGEIFNTEENLRLFFGDDRSKGAPFEDYSQAVHPDDREYVMRRRAQLLEGGPRDIEYRVVWPDGSVHVLFGLATVVRGEQGQPIRVYGTNLDITERKQAEAAIRSLLQISEKLHATLDIDALLDSLVIEAMKLTDAEIGWSGLRTEEGMVCHTHIGRDLQVVSFPYLWPPEVGLPGWVLVHKVPYVMNDALSDKMIIPEIRERFGVNTAIDTPILDAQGEVIGFFEVNNKRNGAGFSESDVEKLVAVSRIASIALQNARLFEAVSEHRQQLLVLSARLAEAQETERRAIARELHDQFGQSLTAMKIDLAWLHDHLPPHSKSLREKVDSALDLTNETIQMTQRLAGQLRPRMLDDLGLAAALEWHVNDWSKHTRIKAKVNLPEEEWELGPSLNTGLYRVCQEALTNVARHAGASKVEVSLAREGDEVVLTVRDNGRGMDGGKISAPESLGLLGMKERVEQIGGRLEVQSEAGKGTTVVARVPVSTSISSQTSRSSPKEHAQAGKIRKGRKSPRRKS